MDDIKKIKENIDKIGNMKVIFEPTIYDNNRIQKSNLQKVLELSQVSLRGWNFPHIPMINEDGTKRPYSISDGIEFYTVWEYIMEAFRFYKSGQFLAKFALLEDMGVKPHGKEIGAGEYIDFLSTIYKITEIILFIRNLIENTDIEGGNITIEINNTEDRKLDSIFNQSIFPFYGAYICRVEKVTANLRFDREEILVNALEIGRKLIRQIFEEFNWMDPSEQMIKTHQENLVNRRI